MTVIKTNVPNDYIEVIEGILGQLSDGMWENSRAMEKYWMGVQPENGENGFIQFKINGWIEYATTSKNLLKKYADCLKKICHEYLKDYKTQADIIPYFKNPERINRNWFNEKNKIEIGYLKRKTYDVIIESDGSKKINFDSGIYKDIFKVSDCKYIYDLLVG